MFSVSEFKNHLKRNKFIMGIYDEITYLYYTYLTTDEKLIKKKFKKRLGYELDLKKVSTYNEKLQWLKLNWYDPKATRCADKYAVREYVDEKIGSQYLNELYYVYESTDQIDVDELPESFVLKVTHGSGFNIICKDKDDVKWDDEFRKIRRWMKNNYYLKNREWIYRDIKPRIICEKYLEQVSKGELDVYKIFCFDGNPKFLYVENDSKRTIDFYDTDWNRIPVEQHYPNSPYEKTKPKQLEEILDLSQRLASDFPHVRVDFYICEERIIFSELTFFNWGGYKKFEPQEFDELFGSYLELSLKK